jgi:hypothetical protein
MSSETTDTTRTAEAAETDTVPEPGEGLAERPADKAAGRPVEEPLEEPVDQSVEAPAERPVETPAPDTITDAALREPDLVAHGIVEGEPSTAPSDETALLEQWSKIQVFFVKDPHAAVAEADALIAEVVEARRQAFDAHRAALTGRWQAEDADTEDLRLTLHDYRKLISVLFPRQA